MDTVAMKNQGTHPQKFMLWASLGSIVMMFAGLTSAYVVKRSQANWLEFPLPGIFYFSTIVILMSSLSMYAAVQAFKAKRSFRFNRLMIFTAVLGILFAAMQFSGFISLNHSGIPLFGTRSNPSASFLGIIAGLHILHVLGGVIALVVLAIRKKTGSLAVEMISTYWHFVDLLWVYLLIFFVLI